MEKLTNVIVERVEVGKSGTSKYGPWQAYSIYFVGLEQKFDYFERNKIIPFEGMTCNMVQYEVVQSGEYTNYRVKNLVPAKLTDSGAVAPQAAPAVIAKAPITMVNAGRDKLLTMCVSYAKDIMVRLLVVNGDYQKDSFFDIIDLVAKGGRQLAEQISKPEEAEPEAKPAAVVPEPKPDVAVSETKPVVVAPTVAALAAPVVENDHVPF